MEVSDLIYDWNQQPESSKVLLLDESLRDGIQSPSVTDPSIEDKLTILGLLENLGIQHITIGFPAASKRAYDDVLRLTQEIVQKNMSIRPTCLARALEGDIIPIVEISEKTSLRIEVMAFVGSSPIRSLVEHWDEDLLVERTAKAVDFAIRSGNPVSYATEDTTRSRPSTIERLFKTALDKGATGLCLADTVGHSTPRGTRRLVEFTRSIADKMGVDAVIDWHGHNDRGLALGNALAAIDAGANRIHGTLLGIGERTGNTPLDQLLINLKLQSRWDKELSSLPHLCELACSALNIPLPVNYPGLGKDSFRTATGIHASAILKADSSPEQAYLSDLVYSAVPASMLGREQEIEIGYMSGAANVLHWLKKHRIMPEKEMVDKILCLAKSMNRVLSDEEILDIVRTCQEASTVASESNSSQTTR